MASVTAEQLKSILDEKLDLKLAPLNFKVTELSDQLSEAMKLIDVASAKYDEVILKLETYQAERKEILDENKILKAVLQQTESQLNQLKNSHNDLEQYSRRECVEIQGIPVPKDPRTECTNDIVLKIGELVGTKIDKDDISVSHRIPVSSRYKGKRPEPSIIVKFVRRDIKEVFYRARNKLKDKTTKDLGYNVSNGIYINESLTERNKDLFKWCVIARKELDYKFIWTSNGRIFLRKNEDTPVIHIKNRDELVKLSQNK